jgi:hypothetical protein
MGVILWELYDGSYIYGSYIMGVKLIIQSCIIKVAL